jgi:electron transport complex protein RnfB
MSVATRHTRALMSDSNLQAPGSMLSIKALDRCLPQTQCTRCGYPRCRDYARALARNQVDINRCPPGGTTTIACLSALTHRPELPLDPQCGEHKPRVLATIVEPHCIGCTLCIQACPVDAIVGRAKRMHTVIASLCTGCELCLPVCPVDCIDLVADTVHQPTGDSAWPQYGQQEIQSARENALKRLRRLARRRREREAARKVKSRNERQRIRDEIRAAVERVKQKRGTR